MSTTLERLNDLVVPVVSELELDLYDLEFSGGTVKVLLDRAGGIDLDAITRATRRISNALDEADFMASAYTLEVSSPGIERTLRTPEHYRKAIGERVRVKTRPHPQRERRLEGELVSIDGDMIALDVGTGDPITVHISDVERARTQFVDPAAPKPGKGARPTSQAKSKQSLHGRSAADSFHDQSEATS